MNQQINFIRLAVSLLLLTGLMWPTPPPVAAHGGGVAQITNAPIGDFITTVWLNPDPPRVGTIHLTIALAQSQNPVLNQTVQVDLVQGNRTLSAAATHENSTSRFLYEADLEVPSAGDWDIIVSVAEADDSVSFSTTVAAESWINRPSTAIAAFAIVGITFAYGIVSGRRRSV